MNGQCRVTIAVEKEVGSVFKFSFLILLRYKHARSIGIDVANLSKG